MKDQHIKPTNGELLDIWSLVFKRGVSRTPENCTWLYYLVVRTSTGLALVQNTTNLLTVGAPINNVGIAIRSIPEHNPSKAIVISIFIN